MEYKPALPDQNDNVSHTRPVREFFLLMSGIVLFFTVVFWAAGLLVDWAVTYISPEMEARIFSGFRVPGVTIPRGDDPRQKALQALVDRLEPCVGIGYPLTVHLVKSETANALALPGGRIIVLEGLLDRVASENGLSFVLAHELAHFKNRDHLRGMGRGIVITALAALVAGPGSEFTQVFAPTVNLNMAQYSQDRESLADRAALETLACSYGHAGGAAEFFRAMSAEDPGDREFIGHYFDSHPQALARIRDLERRIETLGKGELTPLPRIFR